MSTALELCPRKLLIFISHDLVALSWLSPLLCSDSLSRKEREEKVRETREKMEKEKEKKLQDLLDAQKTGETITLRDN